MIRKCAFMKGIIISGSRSSLPARGAGSAGGSGKSPLYDSGVQRLPGGARRDESAEQAQAPRRFRQQVREFDADSLRRPALPFHLQRAEELSESH